MRVFVFALLAVAGGAVLGVPIQDDVDEEEFSGAGSSVVANLQEQVKGLLEHRRSLDKELDTIKIANQIELTALREEIENLRWVQNKFPLVLFFVLPCGCY
jgi:hypothetical protein